MASFGIQDVEPKAVFVPSKTVAKVETLEDPAQSESTPTNKSPDSTSDQDDAPAPAVQEPNAALAARMARFKDLKAQKAKGKDETTKAVATEKAKLGPTSEEYKRAGHRKEEAEYKLAKLEDADGRKRAWDYMVDESEKWDKHVAKKQRNKDSNVFSDHQKEANKVYKRQVKRMGTANQDRYKLQKAEKIRDQIQRGVLLLQEDEHGEPYAFDPVSQKINEPAEEEYQFNHKPKAEDIDRVVNDEVKREQARLAARAKRLGNDDDSGDVTYINEKNKQFNNKLARFYNKFTSEIRENFERGTAI